MSEGPISAEQLRALISHCIYDPIDMPAALEKLNALIRPMIESAVANAAAEMRETCAEVIANKIRLREMDHDAGGHAMCHLRPIDELEQDIRALPLSPASDAWLRRVVECTASRLSNADKAQRELWVNHEIASILAEAAKGKP